MGGWLSEWVVGDWGWKAAFQGTQASPPKMEGVPLLLLGLVCKVWWMCGLVGGKVLPESAVV